MPPSNLSNAGPGATAATTTALVTFAAFASLLRREMPWVASTFPSLGEVAWRKGHVRMRAVAEPSRVARAGGTVSGPALFALADVGAYAAVLSAVGLVPLAVTTDMSMHFLRKPELGEPIDVDAVLLKTGKRLVVSRIELTQRGAVVAHAVGTYSVPPGSSSKGHGEKL